ncbi:MAG: rRNA pseudouridine synthase [Lachnospiraceae bacterium]|nr:rRNA pseudouridine synthase [Lachnospiraceae bacterium]
MTRLDKYVSENLPCTRSEAKKLICSGRISVKGEIIKVPDFKIEEDCDVFCGQKRIEKISGLYFMLNKPAGVISTVKDDIHKTVNDLFPKELASRIFPVGRLDVDTEGLLIMTDDGDFCHRLESPKKNVYKTYFAKCSKKPSEDAERIFEEGIAFKDYTTRPARLRLLGEEDGCACVEVEICEGRFHQVKRMLHHVGADVIYLKRTGIGRLKLDQSLEKGTYRALNEEELKMLTEN